jgi:peptidoglycan-associated lipoprotein
MLRILSAFAALLLVAACSTDPESSKTSKGDSQTTGQSSSSSVNTSSIAPGSMEDFVVNVGDRVFFALDSSELSSTAQDTLAK